VGALSWCSPAKQAWGWVRKLNTWRVENWQPAQEQGGHILSVTYTLKPEHPASLYHLDKLNSQEPKTLISKAPKDLKFNLWYQLYGMCLGTHTHLGNHRTYLLQASNSCRKKGQHNHPTRISKCQIIF
jgi:hypothetical protein